jgi:alkylation response protein AidB-like acyl-CoA dehydrogenase
MVDFRLRPEDEALRQEVEEFVVREFPLAKRSAGDGVIWRGEDIARIDKELMTMGGDSEATRVAGGFLRQVAERKYHIAGWPKAHGGLEYDFVKRAIIKEVMAYHRAPASFGPGPDLIGPTLMVYGTDEQRDYHLPLIANNEVRWSQFFSEPDAGSDLANTQVRAVADGDDFIINGVKVWHDMGCQWYMGLFRTDDDAPKHRGSSVFLIEADTPGLRIEPLINLVGGSGIGKTTFENVRVSKKHLVGELNRGWYVAMAVMNLERSGVQWPAAAHRDVDELTAWAKAHTRGGRRVIDDPIVAHKLAQARIEVEVGLLMAYRIASLMDVGYVPDMEASMTKTYGSELSQRISKLATDVIGPHSQLTPESTLHELGGRHGVDYVRNTVETVALGSSEIMRNIVATRGLGLPRG